MGLFNIGKDTALPSEAEMRPLLDEAVKVVDDFLKIGKDISFVTICEYEGQLGIHSIVSQKGHRKGDGFFWLVMYNTGDINQKTEEYKRKCKYLSFDDMYNRISDFLGKYGNCYNPSLNAYEYHFKNSIKMTESQKQIVICRITEEIREKCPLAELEGNTIYTKDVYCRR